MTLNQVVKRIRTLALAHRQLRDFRTGLVSDFFNDKTARYPAALLQDNGGSISTAGHATTLNWRLFLVDLVHVAANTNDNQLDVQSDMLSVAMDLVAQMNAGIFDDWFFSGDNTIQLIYEGDNDLYGGCYFDFSLRIVFTQDICQIPADAISGSPTDSDMKVYDLIYNATGAEGSTLTPLEVAGKKILMMTRENNIVYRASNLPGSTEYTFDGAQIGLGTPVNMAGERFLILYRSY